jgi:hypothetical protein
MTISLSTYRTPTTTTLDSLFDSLFDPFFESVTIPRKRTASMVNTKVTTEDDKHIISVAKISADYHQGILRVAVEKPEVTAPETVTIKVS